MQQVWGEEIAEDRDGSGYYEADDNGLHRHEPGGLFVFLAHATRH